SGSVINRSRPQVPGIEVTRYNNNLLRVLSAFQVCDHVVARLVRQSLRCQSQAHSHSTLRGKIADQVGILGRHRARWDLRSVIRVSKPAGVGQTIVGTSNRANKASRSAKLCCLARTYAAIDDSLPVGIERKALRRQPRVELHIEQDYFSADRGTSRGMKLFEALHNNDLGKQSLRWCCRASAKSCEHDLLRCFRRLPLKLGQLADFDPSNPVGNHQLLELNLEPEAAHFSGDILNGLRRL